MNSNPRRPKATRTTSDSDKPEDRLGSLHDSVLCHILSFLPTKYAAITSLLSTRWKCLFLAVPNIDLDDSLLLKPQIKEGSSSSLNQDFINFINRRLMLCKASSITKFRLKCLKLPEAALNNIWLTTILLSNVKVVEIEVQSWESPPLCPPSGMFWSETLVVLKLCGRNIVFKIPEYVCFSKLKVLKLKDLEMQFESNNFRLAEEGYPMLEDLSLDRIRFPKNMMNEVNINTLGINLSVLKKLAIIGLEYPLRRIDIDTPHLQHLECAIEVCANPKIQISLSKRVSLLSADLDMSAGSWLDFVLRGDQACCIKYLRMVNKVKELHLSGDLSLVLSWYDKLLPRFPNLTHLELTARGELVWNLIQRTPNLKTLVCHLSYGDCSLPRENEPPCFPQDLREIRIRDFNEAPVQFEVVRFFLQNGAVLERMTIERPRHKMFDEWPSSIWKQLLMLGRRSPKCAIQLI